MACNLGYAAGMRPSNLDVDAVLPPCRSWGSCDHASNLLHRAVPHQCRDRAAHQVHHCIYCGESPEDGDQVVVARPDPPSDLAGVGGQVLVQDLESMGGGPWS